MEVSQLSNLRHAYEELERRVQRALNTQVGDSERLEGVQEEVLLYIQAVEQVCDTGGKGSITQWVHGEFIVISEAICSHFTHQAHGKHF